MIAARRIARMTRAEFLDWAPRQDVRYEFDGFAPVAMTGGTVNHNRIMLNIQAALRARLKGSGCEPLGPDAGVATIGEAVRYPDALVTCAKVPGTARVVPGVVIVFEVLSPSSARADRIEKLLEYGAVPSILRYVVVESAGIGVGVFAREADAPAWTATALVDGATLTLPEIGIDIPIAEFYDGVDFPDAESAA
jgi:Uma2 family endonuclease